MPFGDIYVNKTTYSCAIFMHRMTEFMIFATATKEETRLTHIEVEAFQASITEAHDWIFFTNVTFCLMLGCFSGS